MPPKEKKKKAKKAPAYMTDEAALQPFGVQAGQLVRTALGCTATVLGAKAGPDGAQLWVRYGATAAGGLEAPLDPAGWAPAAASEQLHCAVAERAREQRALDDKWRAYNEAQAAKEAEAAKAAAKKKKKPAAAAAAAAGEASGGEAAAAAAAEAPAE